MYAKHVDFAGSPFVITTATTTTVLTVLKALLKSKGKYQITLDFDTIQMDGTRLVKVEFFDGANQLGEWDLDVLPLDFDLKVGETIIYQGQKSFTTGFNPDVLGTSIVVKLTTAGATPDVQGICHITAVSG